MGLLKHGMLLHISTPLKSPEGRSSDGCSGEHGDEGKQLQQNPGYSLKILSSKFDFNHYFDYDFDF